jgi:hypothetical protein
MKLVERLRLGGPNALEVTDQAADEIERLTKLSRELDNELKFACEELAFAYRGIVGGYGLDEAALKKRAAYHIENLVKPAPHQT